ncbi:transposase [Bacteroidia bacterium]|nr:transposase [Bacteroidia bacterium]GHT63251.1 transposase [Bacteroidia bacterium]
MAKRPTVEVDEEYLLGVMAGGVAYPKKEQPKSVKQETPQTVQLVKEEEKETVSQPVGNIEPKETVKPVRKRKEVQDYEAVFLERKASVPRRQTYMDAALYEKINSFLPVIAGHQFGITPYINNVLTHHLEQYREDINELYEKKSQKPF